MIAQANAKPLLQINISTFPGGDLETAEAVRQAFLAAIQERSLDELGPVEVRLVGWRGIEGKDVMVEIRDELGVNLYEYITPDMVPRIMQSHIDDKRPLRQWLVGRDYQDFIEYQKLYITELIGKIDPLSWEEYQDYDGYKGLRTFFSQGFDSFLQKVVATGFREVNRMTPLSLGPLWCEWRLEKRQPILLLNGAPPVMSASPAMYMLEGVPHQILEGALLAAQTLKAKAVVIYLPEEAALAGERLRAAWNIFQKAPLWPTKIPLVDIFVISGKGQHLMEDEELLIRSISGLLPPMFWQRYPEPQFLVHSLLAISTLPFIAQQPVAWFRSQGFEFAPGTVICHLSGSVERPGFVEMPLHATIGDIINKIGGGWRHGRQPKGFLVGGPVGGIFPKTMLDLTLSHDKLRELGGGLAVGSIQVLDDHDCIVALVRDLLVYILDQPGAQTPDCQRSLLKIKDAFDKITEGTATYDTLAQLQMECEEIQTKASSQLARLAVNPIYTALEHFGEEFRHHIENHYCDAQVCPKLLSAPCHMACPAGIDIPSFLALIAQGNHQEAWEVMREDNPFPWVCGLVCPHPCERACVRANLDEPINIRYLKAFAADWVDKHGSFQPPPAQKATGKKVAVIGSGPAGLSCAYFLALKGHQVTVFEQAPVPGGLLVAAIPDYRLARRIVAREVEMISALGVEIRTGVTVGQDVTLDDLRAQGYGAFFMGIGAHLGYKLKIEGENDFPQVYDVISFLRGIYLGEKKKPADKVVIIGGGNAAMDAARTCIRLGCQEVHVSYRRTRAEMPAHPEEVAQALEEGVNIHFLTIPIRIGGNGKVEYLECLQAELGRPDASGRRRPIPIPDSNYRIEAGAVITAIGQQPDFCAFPVPPIQTTPWCTIVTETATCRTSVKDIFAGGDAVTGPATVVEAIAAGKQAAMEIDHFLFGRSGPAPMVRFQKRRKVPFLTIPGPEKINNHRHPVPMLDIAKRTTTFEPVELSYNEEEARKEAQRCLRCDVCIRCSTCERVCRDQMHVYALKFSQITTTERVLTDYQRVQERCIACGACALACPTQAIQYVEADTYREVRLCGTVLNHLETSKCSGCGEPFVPARYLSYVTNRSDGQTGKNVLRRLCAKCARRVRAEKFAAL
ncbi:MAG: FAD-dependent oxidoreductase [Desulfobacca sp.]|uniref:FAD-dependent oxidoreductase n=1 Tax=Desulfobacca sp. TaxID=2067990 RepID=UPI00404AEE7F